MLTITPRKVYNKNGLFLLPTRNDKRGVIFMELKIKDLSLNYFGHFDSLHSIEHTFVSGVNAVFGEFGSGKTTLLKAIAGLIEPYQGSVELDGQALKLNKSTVVSLVFDDLGFFERRSLAYNMEYPLKIRKIPKDERKITVEGWLQKVNVSPNYLSDQVFRIPSQQRVECALVRGFAKQSQVILLDNPLSCLNPSERRLVFFELLRLFAENSDKIIIYATDSAEEVRLLDCPTLVLSLGYVAGRGKFSEITQTPQFLTPSELLIPYFNTFEIILTKDGFALFGKDYKIDFSNTLAESFIDKKAVVGFKPEAVIIGEISAKKTFEVSEPNGKIYLLDVGGTSFYSCVCSESVDLDTNKIYIFDDVSGRLIYPTASEKKESENEEDN